MSNTHPLVCDLELGDFREILVDWGEPPYRATQIWHGLYKSLWADAQHFTNLPAKLREKLGDQLRFTGMTPDKVLISNDKETTKTLLKMPDGLAIEAVLMRYARRRTLCISTQAGCAMGCVFCATGQMGFQRHLSSGEIVEQVLYYARILQSQGQQVTNIVIMGMGEPFHNYEATMKAIDRLNHPEGFNFGARRFTISTVGLVPMIHRFASEQRQVNLAVSLHAVDDDLRSQLLPVNRRYPVGELLQACRDYVNHTHRRITFEWALIQDVNDSEEQAFNLAQHIKDLLCHVNIIPLNPTQRYPGQATTQARAQAFQAVLERHKIPCSIRVRRGIDIQAGCGQLANKA